MLKVKDCLPTAYKAFEGQTLPTYLHHSGNGGDMNYTPESEVAEVIQRCMLASDLHMLDGGLLRVWMNTRGLLYGLDLEYPTRIDMWNGVGYKTVKEISDPLSTIRIHVDEVGYRCSIWTKGCDTVLVKYLRDVELFFRKSGIDLDIPRYIELDAIMHGDCLVQNKGLELFENARGFVVRDTSLYVSFANHGPRHQCLRPPKLSDVYTLGLQGELLERVEAEIALNSL